MRVSVDKELLETLMGIAATLPYSQVSQVIDSVKNDVKVIENHEGETKETTEDTD